MTTKTASDFYPAPLTKKLMIPIGAIILVIIGALVLLVPQFKKISVMVAQNKKVMKERQSFIQKAQVIAGLDEEKLRKNALMAVYALPREKDLSLVLYGLTDPARMNNFYVESMEFRLGEMASSEETNKETETDGGTKAGKKKSLEEIPIEMTLLGSGSKISSFLADLEKTLPIMTLKKVEGSFSKEGATLKLSLVFFLNRQLADYKPQNLSLADLTLTVDEEKILQRIGEFNNAYDKLKSVQSESSLVRVGRSDPFNLNP